MLGLLIACFGLTQRGNEISSIKGIHLMNCNQSMRWVVGMGSSQPILGSMDVRFRSKIFPRTVNGVASPMGSDMPSTIQSAVRLLNCTKS